MFIYSHTFTFVFMCVDKYGLLKLLKGMKLPKYNLSYHTRDLIHSLVKSTCERKHVHIVLVFNFALNQVPISVCFLP